MATNRIGVLSSLVTAADRLTRLAAQETGSTTSSAAWAALGVLANDGPHRIGDLARATRISQPGMTKTVQNLVGDEWVLRIADVEDSRAWLIAITPTGRTALERWRTQIAEALEPSFGDLDAAEWATLAEAAAILSTRAESKAEAA
jgi:DNA-binding MarR family transcriptional regulator